jgi:hypothetical protein
VTTSPLTRSIVLLGPQRRPSVQHVVRELGLHTPPAAINAGWRERETDDDELREQLGGRIVNLALHTRWHDVHERDREYAHAEREHGAALDELRRLYLTQLDHALLAAYDVAQRIEGRPRLREAALTDAVEVVRLTDRQHLARVRAAEDAFDAAWRPRERPVIAEHAEEVRRLLAETDALVIAGGHVGDLARVLRLFDVRPHLPRALLAWSAGAMVLCDHLVLFHDFVPHGVAQTEVFGEGLGIVPGVVALPHARRRLRTNDPVRMSVLARRFAPSRCLVLDDAVVVRLAEDGGLPTEARLLGVDGTITTVGAA